MRQDTRRFRRQRASNSRDRTRANVSNRRPLSESCPLVQMNPKVPLPIQAPPSTVRISPVMKPACSETRNATASATSDGLPHRRSGTVSVIRCTASGEFHNCFAAPGVSIGPGRDGVDADVVLRPLDGQRLRHRHHACLRRGRVDGAGAPGPDVVGQDRHDRAAAAARDHVPADRARAVEAAVQHDADDRVPAVGRQILGLADEVAGGVVDQDVDAAEVADDARDHLVHLFGVPDVDLHDQRIEPGMAQLGAAAHDVLRVAAANRDARAELAEARRDREPEARAAARHDGHLILQQRGCEHRRSELRLRSGSVGLAARHPKSKA